MPETDTQNANDRVLKVIDSTRGAAERCERPDLVSRLDQAAQRLRQREVTVLVIGEFKQGKSTLVNAILNAAICPVDDDVATAVATIVRHSEASVASITYGSADDPDESIEAEVRIEDVGAYITSGLLAGTDQIVRCVEVGLPRQLLQSGLRLVDTPGVGGLESAHGMATMGALAMADAVLFVTDSSQEFTASELDFLTKAAERCPTVVCVLPKIDFYPNWRLILDANREHLTRAALDIDILPVSSALRLRSITKNDRQLNVESGFPDLLSRLRDDIISDAERTHHLSAANDIRAVATQLSETENAHLGALTNPEQREELIAVATEAKDRADRMRSAAARWSTTLNDGITDLTSNTDHDLRRRSRELLAEVEALIDENDPTDIADELFPMVEQRLMADFAENYSQLRERASTLSELVFELFDADTPRGDIPEVAAPIAAVEEVGSLDVELAERPTFGQSMMTGLRGSYGGVMMFGMMGAVVGLATFGPLSIGAGALLGRKAAKEERDRQLTVRRQQAKMGIRKYIDEVSFRVNKHSRDTLKQIQRELRDANLTRAQELSVTANQSLKAAQGALKADEAETAKQIKALEASLDQLSRIRAAADQIEQR